MKNLKLLGSFKSSKFRYGGYATLITAIVITVFIVINLIAGMIPYTLDLTPNQLFTLSLQTTEVLGGLQDDIKIYGVYELGKENDIVGEILNRYSNNSRRVSVDYLDPIRDPLAAQRYTKSGERLQMNSLIVESGDRFRVIKPDDLLNYSMIPGQTNIESLAVEQRLTAAILYVTGAEISVVYTLNQHGEKAFNPEVMKQMELENYELRPLNLLVSDGVPEDASILIVNSPKRDLTPEAEQAIRDYLERQGRAIFLMDVVIDSDLPRFQSLFQSYGIALNNRIIIEGANDRYAGGNRLWVVPRFANHVITAPIAGAMTLILPGAQGINVLDVKRHTLEVEPLLRTSDRSYARLSTSTSPSMEREQDDIGGPFDVGVTIVDTVYDNVTGRDKITKLVVYGNSTFLDTGMEAGPNLILNSMNWLHGRQGGLTIRPKNLGIRLLTINEMQYRIYSGITVILIPLFILAVGLIVWLRRRHL